MPGGPHARVESWEEPSPHEGFRERRHVLHTPTGDLEAIDLFSPEGKPGYRTKYFLESVEDCHKWLSLPEPDYDIDPGSYWEADRRIGDRGLVMVGFPEPMYFIHDKMGSELFALMSVEQRDMLHQLIGTAYRHAEYYLHRVLEHGIRGLFGYAEPELCIPPLHSPADFDDFVTRYDLPLIDLIHDAGGLVWCHCHGNMDPVLERFADDLKVDCLNPIEPPPVGIPLDEAKQRVGDRMSLEGNVQVGWFDTCSPDEIRDRTRQALREAMPGGGFILCPTSDHSHWPVLDGSVHAKCRAFVETAAENWWYGPSSRAARG